MFEELYGEIPQRLERIRPENGFNIEDLFTKDEWASIGDGYARQQFGGRFSREVTKGAFPGVTRNVVHNNPGGNEARYDYNPEFNNDQ